MKYPIYGFSVLVLFLLFGCAPKSEYSSRYSGTFTGKDYSKEDIANSYDKAEKNFQKGRLDESIEGFEDFVSTFPYSDLVDDALFRMGEIYFSKEDYDKSVASFQKILQNYPTSSIYDNTRQKLAISHLRLRNFQESIQILKSLLSCSISKEREAQVYLLLGENYEGLNDYLVAISYWNKAIYLLDNKDLRRELEDRIEEIIDIRMVKNDLLEVINNFRGQFPSGYAEFKLANIYLDEKELNEAILTLVRMLNNHPIHECRLQAQTLLNEISQKLETDMSAIGCILPLTGKYSVYGEKALHGIELAADVFTPSQPEPPIKLIIKDSEGDSEVAANKVEELVFAGNVICIIGPLLSIAVEAAAERAEELEVPMVILSQKRDITEVGEYVFQNSLTPDLQTREIVEYAITMLGLRRFAILYPNNHYGNNFMNLFWDKVLRHGGEIIAVESYESDQYDFQDEIRKLVGLYYSEENEEDIEDEELRPTIDFDAIFIPDYYDKVGLIVPQLAYWDVIGIRLLGTNGWNSPHLIRMAKEYVQGAVFVDGFFENSPYPFVQKFVYDFGSTFGEQPGILEAQAYDSANMIIDLIRNHGVETRIELKEGLSGIRNYPGVSGATSFDETGDSDKMLFMLTVKGNNIEQLR